MQTSPLLMSLGWFERIKLYPSISRRLSGIEESRYVSDKHMKSCLCIEIWALKCVSFEKLWADKLVRFQKGNFY